jgi:hypothetical protein
VYVASDNMILGEEVLGECVGEGSNHERVQDERCGAGNESEDADATFVDLKPHQSLRFPFPKCYSVGLTKSFFSKSASDSNPDFRDLLVNRPGVFGDMGVLE